MGLVKKVRQVLEGGFRGRERYLATVDRATEIPNLSSSRECGVLPTTGSHGTCSESSREFLPVRLVFPDAVVTSASSTKRRLYGAKRSLYRGERCVDSGANRTTIVTARPTKAGRSAGGANAAVHSSGKPRVDDEARGSPPAVRHGFENWRRPVRKRRRKESSSW